MNDFFRAVTAVLLAYDLSGCATSIVRMDDNQRSLVAAISKAKADHIHLKGREDRGVVVDAKISGRSFSLAVPANWNHQTLLFAHGYTTPGTSLAVPKDPVKEDISEGMLPHAYGEGYAVGISSFDKSGLGVESATINTLRLRNALTSSGSTRVYVAGGSMGGNVVMSLIDRYPGAFAGALSACGVTDGWETQFEHMIDMRVVYNALTAGTRYALPGVADARIDALSPAPGWSGFPGNVVRLISLWRLSRPILALFKAAKADPAGGEARIIRQVASISGYEPDIASFAFPLTTVALGMNDMRATWGGMVYGNRNKTYASPYLSQAEARNLNETVQRLDADNTAVVKARAWHEPTGRSVTPLIAIHNRIDALVLFSQATGLRDRLRAANNNNAVQYVAEPIVKPLPIGGVSGYTHCGFTPRQTGGAWDALRAWVEGGTRPGASLP